MKSDTPLILLQGNGTLKNRGCEAILYSTIKILKNNFKSCKFINVPGYCVPEESLPEKPDLTTLLPGRYNRWSFEWLGNKVRRRLHLRVPFRFEKYLSDSAVSFVLGGDIYSLDYGIPVSYMCAIDTTLKRGVPLVLWGATVGPFSKDKRLEEKAAQQLKQISLICARESETVRYLKRLGVTENVKQVADPAFVLDPEPIKLEKDLEDFLEESCIGINFSPLLRSYWSRDESPDEVFAACIEEAVKVSDMQVLLIPHVMYSGNDDRLFLRRLRQRLPRVVQERVRLLDRDYNAMQLKWIISKLHIMIGARTHATIAALSTYVPTISVGYSMKSIGINKDIFGHTNWLISLDELTRDRLRSTLSVLLNKRESITHYLREIMPMYRDSAFSAAGHVKELLKFMR